MRKAIVKTSLAHPHLGYIRIVPGYSFSTQNVKLALEKAYSEGRKYYGGDFEGPKAIVTDNGPSFVSQAALYPSFPRSLTEVRIICDRYRWYHNFQRPHWSDNLRTPAEVYLEKEWAEVRRLGLEKLKGLDRIEKLSEVI